MPGGGAAPGPPCEVILVPGWLYALGTNVTWQRSLGNGVTKPSCLCCIEINPCEEDASSGTAQPLFSLENLPLRPEAVSPPSFPLLILFIFPGGDTWSLSPIREKHESMAAGLNPETQHRQPQRGPVFTFSQTLAKILQPGSSHPCCNFPFCPCVK